MGLWGLNTDKRKEELARGRGEEGHGMVKRWKELWSELLELRARVMGQMGWISCVQYPKETHWKLKERDSWTYRVTVVPRKLILQRLSPTEKSKVQRGGRVEEGNSFYPAALCPYWFLTLKVLHVVSPGVRWHKTPAHKYHFCKTQGEKRVCPSAFLSGSLQADCDITSTAGIGAWFQEGNVQLLLLRNECFGGASQGNHQWLKVEVLLLALFHQNQLAGPRGIHRGFDERYLDVID